MVRVKEIALLAAGVLWFAVSAERYYLHRPIATSIRN